MTSATRSVTLSADDALRTAGEMTEAVRWAINGADDGAAVQRVLATLAAAVDAQQVSLTRIDPDSAEFAVVASTVGAAASADELQRAMGEGPAVQAAVERQTIICVDTVTGRRWPAWRAAATELGVRSAVCLPLLENDTLGSSVNLYSGRTQELDHRGLALMDLAVKNIAAIREHSQVKDHLTTALDSRAEIGRAQGIIMRQFAIPDEKAFEVLRRYSQHNNIKLRVVAQAVVDRGELPSDRDR